MQFAGSSTVNSPGARDAVSTRMRKLLVLLVAALALAVGGSSHARRHPSTAIHKVKKKVKHRARARPRLRSTSPFEGSEDELVLSKPLMKQLQRNLVDGGYLAGRVDGRLDARTRRALADFQREYHLHRTGTIDRATAEALLGRDIVGAYLVASAPRTVR